MATPICITCGSTGKLVTILKPNRFGVITADPNQVAFICSKCGHNETYQVHTNPIKK